MSRNNGYKHSPSPAQMKLLVQLSPDEAEQAERENWPFEKVSETIDDLKNEQENNRHSKIWDIQEYDYDDNLDIEHPPLKWFIPDLLHVGLTQVSGAPKTGKSLQIMNMGLQLAKGLNNMTLEGSMLYLALEDNPRRIKQRGLSM